MKVIFYFVFEIFEKWKFFLTISTSKGPLEIKPEKIQKPIFFQKITVSTLLQPRGSIFQNGFLGGVQFKFS